jgi:hypothetical protein
MADSVTVTRSDLSIDDALEAALHAHVMQRCERAFVHELRDGLQAVAVSIDAFARIYEQGPSAIERLTPIAKRALQTHNQAIERIVHQMVLHDDRMESVNIDASLRHLLVLLRNEAAKRDVNIVIESAAMNAAEGLTVRVRPGKSLLAMLSIAIRLIDSQQGESLRIAAQAEGDTVKVKFVAVVSADSRWDFATGSTVIAERFSDHWILHTVRRLITADNGTIETHTESVDGAIVRTVRISYPR